MDCSRKELLIAVGISLGIIVLCVALSIAGYFYLLNQSSENESTPSPSGMQSSQKTAEPSATPRQDPQSTETAEKLTFVTTLEKSYLFTNTLESLICIFSLIFLLGSIFVFDYISRRRNKNGGK